MMFECESPGIYPCLANCHACLFPLQAGLGYRRSVVQSFDAALDQLFVVELNAIGCLVLDAVPQFLEFRTEQNGFSDCNRFAVIGVLHFQLAGKLLQ